MAEAGLKVRPRLQLAEDEKEKNLNAILFLCSTIIKNKLINKSLKITEFFSSEDGGVLLNFFRIVQSTFLLEGEQSHEKTV